MSSIKVNIEIGHEASLKSKKTPEGFTHDWEVFVRGLEGADISHFVEKVVFYLHDTFPKPRRVVKEPPFSIKESGYAGFMFPIEIYLKNKDEPKKIKFQYDFTLQQSGSLKDRYIFHNPNEEFRKKLLKGGGIPINNNAYYTNPDQETRGRDLFAEDKQQLISKPKLSSDSVKKHKIKEPKEEIPLRTNNFENLFGPPIQRPPKVSPDPKKIEKNLTNIKQEKKEKSSSDKKSKYEHKEAKQEKVKIKEEKDKTKSDKTKSHSKSQDKAKEKSTKRTNEAPPSPDPIKKRCHSPNRKMISPLPRSSSASSIKDDYKPLKHNSESYEIKKNKSEEKPTELKEKDQREKKKKEKKNHDKDKDRRDKKDHKKESHKLTQSPKEPTKDIMKTLQKSRETPKDRELVKETTPNKEKVLKSEKNINKFSIENLKKSPLPDNEDSYENHKLKEKGDSEKKHKHKKKDKKRDEPREKHKESSKEKKHKHEKTHEVSPDKPEIIEQRQTPVHRERPLPDPGSPISIDTASQCSSKSEVVKTNHTGTEELNSSHSDSESSLIGDEDDTKIKVEIPSPRTIKTELSPEPEMEIKPEPEVDPDPEPEPEPPVEPQPAQQKDRSKKHKDKSKKEEKRRKRKAAAEDEQPEGRKIPKSNDMGNSSNDTEQGECSGSSLLETKVQDNGVSSSLGEDAEPGEISPDYMVQLRSLQQRIMMIKNNEDLEKVVNLIAETGRYEVTTQTFDFDLCLLDRSTVQQLIQLVGC